MRVRKLLTERFQDYKFPCMYISACWCDWKCCPDHPDICQNSPVARMPIKDIPDDEILDLYESDPITQAIVIAGLEPLIQANEVIGLIRRAVERNIRTTFIIYTGYTADEAQAAGFHDMLCTTGFGSGVNVVIKYGRFIPGRQPHLDSLLGVELVSDNQYARQIENPCFLKAAAVQQVDPTET